MKLIILYRPKSEHARPVEDLIHDFERQYKGSLEIEVVDVDSRQGVNLASVYGIMRYPGLMVVDNFGSAIKVWQGDALPRLVDIAGAAG